MQSTEHFPGIAAAIAVVVGLAVASASPAKHQAGDVDVYLHGLSYHLTESEPYDYNEVNPGLGASYRFSDAVALEAGFFEASYDHQVEYVGLDVRHDVAADTWLGVLAGPIHGYRERDVVHECRFEGRRVPSNWVCREVGLRFGDETTRAFAVPYLQYKAVRVAWYARDVIAASYLLTF